MTDNREDSIIYLGKTILDEIVVAVHAFENEIEIEFSNGARLILEDYKLEDE